MNLGPTINTAANELNATLSPDARTLIFASMRTGGFGGYDLWMSTRHRAGTEAGRV